MPRGRGVEENPRVLHSKRCQHNHPRLLQPTVPFSIVVLDAADAVTLRPSQDSSDEAVVEESSTSCPRLWKVQDQWVRQRANRTASIAPPIIMADRAAVVLNRVNRHRCRRSS